uniref:DUF5581 domain-containing protein n=1 Tax=Oryzias latipes TaxID=8090 RepID=A0A3P9ILU5_ORYLA
MQERLLLKQRSSYYFVIQKKDVRPWENQQESTSMSINMLGSHLGSSRLQHVKDWMKSQIVFLLAYLEMLFQEIITSRKNLEAFVAKCEKAEVDADEIASAEQQLQQIQLHLRDFEARMASNLEPLTLNSLFLLHTRGSLTHQSQMSVVTLGPVMFHREKALLTHKSVCLFWYIAGEQSEEPRRMFRITVKSAAPGGKLWREAVCCNYEHCVQNLQPDTYYTFTVKRITNFTLVHVPWTDTLHLKTLMVVIMIDELLLSFLSREGSLWLSLSTAAERFILIGSACCQSSL